MSPIRIYQLVLLVAFMLTTVLGCSGSSQQLSPEELEKRRKEQQESLKASNLVSLPTDVQRTMVTVKPGHWVETTQRFKSTKEDLQVLALGSVMRGAERVALPSTNFVNEFTRRSNLPKDQEKSLSLRFYVPPRLSKRVSASEDFSTEDSRLAFSTQLLTVPMMAPILESGQRSAVNELRDHEYQLSVLSPQALAYQHLASLDAINWYAADDIMASERVRSYEISLLEPVDNEYALPHSLLTMTSIAVIVWDDVIASDLTEDQQRAIVDWLHWGGQLIISGPSSWSRLQGSFLAKYLPSNNAQAVELDSDSFAELSNHWLTRDLGKLNAQSPIEITGIPVPGLKMQLNDRGAWMPGSGELVAESQIGRGRIALTAFPLREPRIYRWPYYSSFFSTGLLRRWPRDFRRTSLGSHVHTWDGVFSSDDFDPRMHSNVRILARDLPKTSTNVDPIYNTLTTASKSRQSAYEPYQWGGAGAWSDHAGLGEDAVDALRAAAGIELPSRSTILKLLGGYLICLVPLNYLVFRLFRRLEFAWLAAPILAISAVVVVTKVAQLDIGFARRSIDIGVLELHEGYSRGHLTQYTALYTSLSSNYSMEFPEVDSAALPLGDARRESRRALSTTRDLRTNYGRADGVVLEPLTVYSNSTEMVRSEQIVDLESPVQWNVAESGEAQILNATKHAIDGTVVVRRSNSGALQMARLGKLDAGQKRVVQWQTIGRLEDVSADWQTDVVTQSEVPDSTQLKTLQGVWIGGLLKRIAHSVPMSAGSTILIGYTDATLGNLKVTPTQEQNDRACIVIAHLTPPDLGRISPDAAIMTRGPSADNDEPVEEGSEAEGST